MKFGSEYFYVFRVAVQKISRGQKLTTTTFIMFSISFIVILAKSNHIPFKISK